MFFSGHGDHLYIPIDPIDAEYAEKWRFFSKSWCRRIGTDGSAKADEGIYDLARIMRVPGTLNVKNPDDPIKTRNVDASMGYADRRRNNEKIANDIKNLRARENSQKDIGGEEEETNFGTEDDDREDEEDFNCNEYLCRWLKEGLDSSDCCHEVRREIVARLNLTMARAKIGIEDRKRRIFRLLKENAKWDDFDDNTTAYQVSHIIDNRYKPSKCKNLSCPYLQNCPNKNYWRRGHKRKKKKKRFAPTDEEWEHLTEIYRKLTANGGDEHHTLDIREPGAGKTYAWLLWASINTEDYIYVAPSYKLLEEKEKIADFKIIKGRTQFDDCPYQAEIEKNSKRGYVQSNLFCKHCGIKDCKYKQQFEGLEKEHGIGIVRQMSQSERIRGRVKGRNVIIDDVGLMQILCREISITEEELRKAEARCAEYVEWMTTDSPIAEKIGKKYLEIFSGRQNTLNGEILGPKIKGCGIGEETVKHDKERLKGCIEAIDNDIIRELKKGKEGRPYHNLLQLAFDLVEGQARIEEYPEMGKGVEIIYFNGDLLKKAKEVVLAAATPHPLDLLAFRSYYPECCVLSPNYEYNDNLITIYQIFGRDGRYPLSSLMRNRQTGGVADTICKSMTNFIKTKELEGAKNEDFLIFGPGEFLAHLDIKKDGKCSFLDSLSGKNPKPEKAIDTANYYGRENFGIGAFLDKKYLVGIGVMNPGRGYYSQGSSFIKDLIFTTAHVHPFISEILDNIQDISNATWAQFESRRGILQFIGRVRPWTENAIEKTIVIYGSIPLEPELHSTKMTFKGFEKMLRREKRGRMKHEILSIIRHVARGKSLKPVKLLDIARELADKYNVPVSTVRRYIDKCIHLFCEVTRSSERSGCRGRPNIVVFSRSALQSLKNRGFNLLYFIRRGGKVLAQLSFGDRRIVVDPGGIEWGDAR